MLVTEDDALLPHATGYMAYRQSLRVTDLSMASALAFTEVSRPNERLPTDVDNLSCALTALDLCSPVARKSLPHQRRSSCEGRNDRGRNLSKQKATEIPRCWAESHAG